MFKVTVLYHHPKDTQHFEEYYAEKHLPMARQMPELSKLELTKFESAPGGAQPAYYRMAELYFHARKTMEETMGSPEGQMTIDDLTNFATGGVTILLGDVEVATTAKRF